MMTDGSGGPPSVEENLRAAICLLVLIGERPQDLDELLSRDERIDERSGDENDENLPIRATSAKTNVYTTASDADMDFEDSLEDLAEDLETIDVDENKDKQSYLTELRDRVLDRLAETLARFKSDPEGNRGFPLGSKHVSSTMMVVYNQPTRVKFLCAKNEGLDQEDTTEDTDFLDSWRKCMECISTSGPAAEHAKASLFTLVLDYQQPRISYYLKKLQEAFEVEKEPKLPQHSSKATLSETSLRELRNVRRRTWVDDNGNVFEIPVNSSTGAVAESETVVSGDSLRNINEEVSAIFDKIDKLCKLNVANDAAAQFTDSQASLLKELMSATLGLWKSVRHQSAIKTRLRNRFRNVQQGLKRQKTVITSLMFLCRVYLGVVTFIDAAERMPMFQSIECVPVPVLPQQSHHDPSRKTPLEVVKSLGITVMGDGWVDYLQRQATKGYFHRLKKQKRHMHAEIQILYRHDAVYTPKNESFYVHRYIGCSKRCCLLCYLFILAHGGFKVRGTHETTTHRWELPAMFSTAGSNVKFRSATENMFHTIITILQNIFRKSYPLTRVELLAQSSAALSTAQTVLDSELDHMEKSQLDMRRMMMMPMVANDAVLVFNVPEKPGFAYVAGGTLGKGREMSLQEAELYKENHIRSKMGLERREEMPPKRESTPRTCRRCRRPSSLRCSACRMSYCSKPCQRKDWKRHVFVCVVRNRPDEFDRLGMILSRRLCMLRDKAARSQLLVDLFSDDDLCRTFGFINCLDSGEVANLLCIYGNMTHIFKCNINRTGIGGGNLGDFVEAWARAHQANMGASSECHCIPWFLEKRAAGFDIPNWEGQYVYQGLGVRVAERVFALPPAAEDPTPLSLSESAVLSLYAHLSRRFNNVPDVYSSEWVNFGFCFCTNRDQRISLACSYIELAESGASLGEIAKAWETSSLSRLMNARGIETSSFEEDGIRFQRPDIDEFGIYRLMAEVSHAVSGRFCDCFRRKGHCHPEHETHLSRESDGDYGFHGTNAWERWQLLNFYHHVFQLPGFDAHKMQQARQHPDREKLEGYLDSLVPDFRRKMGNMYLADVMFPKLKGRVLFPHGRPHCYCVVHDVLAPEGLDWRVSWQIRNSLRQENFEEGEEDDTLDSR
ncbi:hypothetical protein F4809DRAFT_612245 [Biscogniauxia mediterranea]|nr:hypothetical protein F4809DRAFT_612245 [Biscogniauxia mediterranea]